MTTFRDRCAEMVAYRAKAYPNEITLPLGANAEPGTCGSCKFFRRETINAYYAMHGDCEIRMPPLKEHFVEKPWPKDADEFHRPNQRINDTFGCDFYQPDGNIYIVQRRIPAEKFG